MSSENGPPTRKISKAEKVRRQQSLDDPNGVRYIDQLWELVKTAEEPLRVVLRTNTQTFADIQSRVWWIRRKPYHWETGAERHQLVFDIPDAVWCRIQTQFVTPFVHELLGLDLPVRLPKARRSEYDNQRRPDVQSGDDATVVGIDGNDWTTLRVAIERTAACSLSGMGGDDVKLHGNIPAKARVVGSQIQVYIGKQVISQIFNNLQNDFRLQWGNDAP